MVTASVNQSPQLRKSISRHNSRRSLQKLEKYTKFVLFFFNKIIYKPGYCYYEGVAYFEGQYVVYPDCYEYICTHSPYGYDWVNTGIKDKHCGPIGEFLFTLISIHEPMTLDLRLVLLYLN